MPSDIIEQANNIAARGAIDQAISLLETAANSGNADAAMQLAVWHLNGEFFPRDFDCAGKWIRQAVIIGHVDGALMEIALTANGYGGHFRGDWAKALELLKHAAKFDPVAEKHLKLVAAMDLNSEGQPRDIPKTHVLCVSPRIVYFERLLAPDECAHIAMVASDLLEPAYVLDPKTGRSVPHPIRTSDGGAIGPAREDLVVRAINQRIAIASSTTVGQGEALTILRYRPGQRYRAHLDTIADENNQRIRTVLIYLNQGFIGGETKFPALDLSVTPRGGDAIVFDTTLADGSPDKRTLHSGEPVQTGVKWLATRWIRKFPYDPWN